MKKGENMLGMVPPAAKKYWCMFSYDFTFGFLVGMTIVIARWDDGVVNQLITRHSMDGVPVRFRVQLVKIPENKSL